MFHLFKQTRLTGIEKDILIALFVFFTLFVVGAALFPNFFKGTPAPGKAIELSDLDVIPFGTVKEIGYYEDSYEGKETSNGENFTQKGFTCANWDLDFNTLVVIEYNGSKIICRVNDRGPDKDLVRKKGREFDITTRAFFKLLPKIGAVKEGVIRNVKVWQIVPEEND